jgi:hypothetical protein
MRENLMFCRRRSLLVGPEQRHGFRWKKLEEVRGDPINDQTPRWISSSRTASVQSSTS